MPLKRCVDVANRFGHAAPRIVLVQLYLRGDLIGSHMNAAQMIVVVVKLAYTAFRSDGLDADLDKLGYPAVGVDLVALERIKRSTKQRSLRIRKNAVTA